MAHQTPEDKARDRLQAQILAAAAAADSAGKHEGHWQLHHVACASGPGDFTPYEAAEDIEEELSPLGEFLDHLAEVLGLDGATERGLEAGQ
jgi:hypothetical protein